MSTTVHSTALADSHMTYKKGGGDTGDAFTAPHYQKHSVQLLFLKSITFINLRILPKDHIDRSTETKNTYLHSI